jgi:hypothetical protein
MNFNNGANYPIGTNFTNPSFHGTNGAFTFAQPQGVQYMRMMIPFNQTQQTQKHPSSLRIELQDDTTRN